MRRLLFLGLMSALVAVTAAADPKETLKSDSYIFETKNGSNTVSIFSKQTHQLIAEYRTVEPVVSLIAVSDISLIIRQLRSKYDHMVDVWVNLENMQIVRARHETASNEATVNAKAVISFSQDPILDVQNDLNLITGEATAAIFASTPDAKAARKTAGVISCEGILMGLDDSLHEDKPRNR